LRAFRKETFCIKVLHALRARSPCTCCSKSADDPPAGARATPVYPGIVRLFPCHYTILVKPSGSMHNKCSALKLRMTDMHDTFQTVGRPRAAHTLRGPGSVPHSDKKNIYADSQGLSPPTCRSPYFFFHHHQKLNTTSRKHNSGLRASAR
jgi:hypothetical protein